MVPFLKWAGGKRWLFTDQFIRQLPPYKRYVEPFVGGGAGFFALEPSAALLCDVNEELINLYLQVRDNPVGVKAGLNDLQSKHSKDFYYFTRSQPVTEPLERALRMLYLNRTCWNGLYRLNEQGEFNVPIGTKQRIVLDTDDFVTASNLLRGSEIRVADFEATLSETGEGDLVFIDPPYTVKHNMNGFVKYNEAIFTWADQQRLRNCAVAAVHRGAAVYVTNADHDSIRELYHGATRISSVGRASVIAAAPSARVRTSELVIQI